METRDIVILGAVGVAGYLYWKHAGSGGALPANTPVAGVGGSGMTASAAATTAPAAPSVSSQVGPASARTFAGFSALNMGGFRFAGSAAHAVIADAVPPSPVVVPSWYGSPTIVGGAGVAGNGASSMGPQPRLTNIVSLPPKLTRY